VENVWLIAALWMAAALLASLISVRIGVSVALVEIFVGVLGGNFLHFQTNTWINFLAGFGSILLTFLAGAEIDPVSLRKHLGPSLAIGTVGFLFPFLGAFAFVLFVPHWNLHAAEIAGIALSTTSVAVVYAVMVETGLNNTELGKLILAACFVNDFGTVLALGVLFANYNLWMLLFVGATIATLCLLLPVARWLFKHWGEHVSEIEMKFFFLILLGLGGLAELAGSEAVLPAYVIGLLAAVIFVEKRALMQRMRGVAFALLTPFFFLKAGTYVLLPTLWTGLFLIVALLVVKMVAKFIGIWPLTRLFHMSPREGNYTTLLMSTGLTFGSISALFGLTHGIITQTQYTILVTVVIGSAVVPTFIAQTWFLPGKKHAPTREFLLAAAEDEELNVERLAEGRSSASRSGHSHFERAE
jgi:Kef-type K+ transport system membrane component KefB